MQLHKFLRKITHPLIFLTFTSYIAKSFKLHRFQSGHSYSRTLNHQPVKRMSGLSNLANLRTLVEPDSKQKLTQFIFVGGKGGVGKTSSSSAIAIRFSDAGFRTLVVSTDPAHSLGDALDVPMSCGVVTPIVTETNLWALEIDVDQALEEFKAAANDLDTESLATSLGVPKDILDSFGLSELSNIFKNPPPGIDEIVALLKVFELADMKSGDGNNRPKYDRIVIDTAPTGHTIRLLQLPAFLNSMTGNLIKLRMKLKSAVDTFKNFFGGSGSSNGNAGGSDAMTALDKLESIQLRLQRMKDTLRNSEQTQFVVVSIPTVLAVAESKRLVSSLTDENIAVSSIIVNQIIPESASISFINQRKNSQQRCIQTLISGLSKSIEYTQIPYLDTEVTGPYGLKFFASIAHPVKVKTATNPISSKKLSIYGGKGGVGKTTCASSWALQLADAGLKVLIVSTDPAHSLGDAWGVKLTGEPSMVYDTIMTGAAVGGQVWGMEVDPVEALAEFKEALQDVMRDSDSEAGGGLGGIAGMLDIKGDLMDMVQAVQEPPPGTDEIVALTKIISLLEGGQETGVRFDRVVVDTAPTGHTLRMLSLPVFLQELLQRLKILRSKLNIPGSTSTSSGKDRLSDLEDRMRRLETILHSPKECEFIVVTIPTEVAVAETKRLLTALEEENVLVRRVLINQVIVDQGGTGDLITPEMRTVSSDAYLTRVRREQKKSLVVLQQLADDCTIQLIPVPYFELETKTVYGLRAIV